MITAADGSRLGPAYGFDGEFVVTLEQTTGPSPVRYFVYRDVGDGSAYATDLLFADDHCSGTPWTEYGGLDAFENAGSFYRRKAVTARQSQPLASVRDPSGACNTASVVRNVYQADMLGPYTAPAAPLDVVPQ